MSINRIGIVGGGPAAISLIKQLLDSLKSGGRHSLNKINVYEKSSKIGPGQAYSNPHDCYILNLPAANMGIVPEANNDFKTWLSSSNYRGTSNFPPRHFFGQYLEHVAAELPKEARNLGVELEYRPSTSVHNILPLPSKKYLIKHKQFQESKENLNEDELDTVVLCTGHLPSNTYSRFIGQSRYYHNPWDDDIYNKTSLGKNVGILGTRLTAIDIALRLKEIEFTGHIHMASRSGLLPTVLSTDIPPYALKYVTLQSLFRLTKTDSVPLRLNDVFKLIEKEIQEASKGKFDLRQLARTDKDITPKQWLKNEIANAESPKSWQRVLFALYPIIPLIWQKLADSDRKEFMDKYYGTFLTYMAAFPVENAKKILDMINSGQLSIIGGVSDIEKNDDTYLIHAHNKIIVDTLFNATGPGSDLRSSPLFEKMEQEKIIARNTLGGIKIDRPSYRVCNIKGIPYASMFAIGNLTIGAYLATSDMSQVAAQASAVVAGISSQVIYKKQNEQLKESTVFFRKNTRNHTVQTKDKTQLRLKM